MKFSEMKYERVDMSEFKRIYGELAARVTGASSADEIIDAVYEHERVSRRVNTMFTLAYIRHSIDTRDAFYSAENDFCDEQQPVAEEAEQEFMLALYSSRFRPELEKKFGRLLFRNIEIRLKTFSPDIVPLLQQENALVSSYAKLIASARIEFDGKVLNTSQMAPYCENREESVRRAAYTALGNYYDSIGDELDGIFDKLVALRTEIAHKLGYSDFTELGYYRMNRNCYTPDDVAEFRRQVVEDIVPISCELKRRQAERIGVDRIELFNNSFLRPDGNAVPKGTAEDLLAAGRRMYREMSPYTAEFIDFLYDNELLDVLAKPGKQVGGYCTDLPLYRAPFIFSNFNGTSGDVDVLTHEAGHAFASYMSRDFELLEYASPTAEACEVHSMSMEFFAWKWNSLFYGDQTEKALYSHLEGCVNFIPYGTMVDHFQHIIYAHPELTPAERHAEWKKLESIYRPYLSDGDLPFYRDGRIWQRQLHIYHYPFYYIDYCLAQTVALEYWAMSQKDYGKAFENYLAYTRKGGSLTFTELCEAGGVISPFKPGALKEIASVAAEWLGKR